MVQQSHPTHMSLVPLKAHPSHLTSYLKQIKSDTHTKIKSDPSDTITETKTVAETHENNKTALIVGSIVI